MKEAQYKNAMNKTEIANLKIQVRVVRKENYDEPWGGGGCGYSMDLML